MVEQRSPKPRAEGSSPSAPAKKRKHRFSRCFLFFDCVNRLKRSARGACRGVRVSGGHLCRRQKHRPSRQVRPSPSAPAKAKKTPSGCLFALARHNLYRGTRVPGIVAEAHPWVMKRGEDGAAVKICRRSKPKQILGTARGHNPSF